MNRILIYIIALLGGVLLFSAAIWFVFFRTPAATLQTGGGQTFPTTANQSSVSVGGVQTGTNQTIAAPGLDISKKIFKVASGPIAGAVLLQTGRPTTTIARYITADTGRVFDIVLDSAGALPRIVSNTTIPGLQRAEWAEGGGAVVGQYMDGALVKTVYLGLAPSSTSTIARAVKIQFLPDNIIDYAISPDGKSVAYLLRASSGLNGYLAAIDGTDSKRLFSLQLSQGLLSWPSAGTLMAQSPVAAGVAGIAFSIDVKSGLVSPLLYANGLSATADRTFEHIVYQVTEENARATYLHTIKTNTDRILSFNPFPENCAWSSLASTSQKVFCFLPINFTESNYLDRWHLGIAGEPDSIFAFDTNTGRFTLIASPGSTDGGVAQNLRSVSVAPEDKYLIYISKGDRVLYGVRLTP